MLFEHKTLTLMEYKLNSLWRFQRWVHVGFIATLTCRLAYSLFTSEQLNLHLHLTLYTHIVSNDIQLFH